MAEHVAVTPEELRKVAVGLRDTADEARRNVAEFTGAGDAVRVNGLLCAASFIRLSDRLEAAMLTRGAKLAAAADALEENAAAYAHGEEINSRLFPTG